MSTSARPDATRPDFAPAAVSVERREDGALLLRSRQPLGDYPSNLACLLEHWAQVVPERVFLAEREGLGPWRTLTYAQAARSAASLAGALLTRTAGRPRPVMVLAGNGIDHALLTLGCLLAGVPVCPVSPAYALMSRDFDRLKRIRELVDPVLVYAGGEGFRPALLALRLEGVELVTPSPVGDLASTPLSDLLAGPAPPDVWRHAARLPGDAVAKILLTSGSTGTPKAVVNTHRMLGANQQMLRQCWPFLERVPPVLLDWLPWNHTFGGNHDFNLVLRNGGTLYVDGGRPLPGLIEQTVANLREVSPNMYFSVPAGYAMLLPYLEADAALARSFLQNLRLIFYAAAALPQDVWDRLERLGRRHLGRPVPMTAAWGATETAPLATTAHYETHRAGVIGLPVPGVELKLVPLGPKLELRVRGPNVTPGYYGQPELTRAAFDEEGFYRSGDAARFLDPAAPEKGLVFDGRTAEDFKLTTGTWVHVGAVRLAALAACSPVLQDVVVCGHDRDQVGLLAWLNVGACRQLSGGGASDERSLAGSADVLAVVREGLAAHNRANRGASSRIARLLILSDPPSIDENEITDKGYVNQRAVVERRAALVQRLFADPPGPDVIVCGPS
jgi:feruloyl-CoA synthase